MKLTVVGNFSICVTYFTVLMRGGMNWQNSHNEGASGNWLVDICSGRAGVCSVFCG